MNKMRQLNSYYFVFCLLSSIHPSLNILNKLLSIKKIGQLGLTGFNPVITPRTMRLLGDSLDIIHTIVPRPIEGRGIAAALVKAAYAYAIANGMKPKATCSYAVKWLERHPELNGNSD